MQGSDDKECKVLLLSGCRSAVGVSKYHFARAIRQGSPVSCITFDGEMLRRKRVSMLH